jgi:hypothetical protein
MAITDAYYTQSAIEDKCDITELREYLYGLDDAIVAGRYKKKYVDTFLMR